MALKYPSRQVCTCDNVISSCAVVIGITHLQLGYKHVTVHLNNGATSHTRINHVARIIACFVSDALLTG